MRLLFLLLCCTVAFSCCKAVEKKETNDVYYSLWETQKFLLEIVWHVQEPVALPECQDVEFVNDAAQYTKFDSDMQRFVQDVQHQRLLPRNDFFSAVVRTHHKQVLGLYKLLAYAIDWTLFKQNVCWARTHINPGMFVYALNLAIRRRKDCEMFELPPIYEIFPQHFFNSEVIHRAMTVSKQKMEMAQKQTHANNGTVSERSLHDWQTWQWWKLMGLSDQHWYLDTEGSVAKRDGLTKYWTPVDYTRDVYILNDETRLSYLLEDVDWNANWYEFNLNYPPFLEDEELGVHHHKRSAERWIYEVRTIMTRYNLERLSQGMKPIADMKLSQTIATGYNPQLVSWNGQTFWQRYNNYEYADYGFPATIDEIFKVTNGIYELADTGVYRWENGTLHDLHQLEAQQDFFNILHGNVNALTPYNQQTYWFYSFMYLAQIEYEQFYKVGPHVLANFETALRDPLFYSLMQHKVLDMWNRYMRNLPAYTRQDLLAVGIEVKSAAISPLKTYFDYADIDLSNLLLDKVSPFDNRKGIYARQQRFQHKPFNYTLHIQADGPATVRIQTFLAPKYDEHGALLSLSKNRENFLEINRVIAKIKAGLNIVELISFDYFVSTKRMTYSEMCDIVDAAMSERLEIPKSMRQTSERFNLPRGNKQGFPVQLVFVVRSADEEQAYGFPFDRQIEHEYAFHVPNVFFMDTMIYHVDHNENIEEYVKGYANFGQFDENYWKIK
ncbi:larval serum protein 1 gamma chain-like [Bactrocera dorsalis]|uniref:Larval serum protein 1 gamma chain-like n=1 Tax=Bactrocera dorsalis TaxID=27457 RepID=A0A6I9UZX5_BACDO|nr:larval serum protein 1 gamma chain-like [Bactrocera dorsalis]